MTHERDSDHIALESCLMRSCASPGYQPFPSFRLVRPIWMACPAAREVSLASGLSTNANEFPIDTFNGS